MSTTQSTFDVFRGKAYAGMPGDGSYQNVDGSQLVSGQLSFGEPASMGEKDRTIEAFDATKPFAGIAVREFYMGDGAIGEEGNKPFDATDSRKWDVDTGVFGRWWVRASNPVKNGQKATLTTDGKWAGGAVVGNFILEGAIFKSTGDDGDLVLVELTGGRGLTEIEAVAP